MVPSAKVVRGRRLVNRETSHRLSGARFVLSTHSAISGLAIARYTVPRELGSAALAARRKGK